MFTGIKDIPNNYSQITILMWELFKRNPVKKLEKRYTALLEKARDAQRSGDIKRYAHLSAEAEEMLDQIEALKTAPE